MSDEQIHLLLRQAFISVEKGFFQSIDDALAEKTELQLQIPEGVSSYEAYQNFPEQVERIQELNDKITGGTTAVVALIFKNKLYVANAGDSRAVLCRQVDNTSLEVEQLSVDHDTQNEGELLRLARLGLDIVNIQRNKRIGSQENTRSIGDYCVKGGYKDFDILSNAAEEPVIADPNIIGGIPIDNTFYALILMSDGLYKCLEEATGTATANLDIVYLIATELQCQSTFNGVAQAVVDKAGRYHHDAFMQQPSTCQKRDDMTVLIRIFNEELATTLNSPRSSNRPSGSAFQPTSPGVLPVSVPFNPSKKNSGSIPTLKIPLPQRSISQQSNQETSSPSSTTSTPTNPTPTMTQSNSEPSSPSQSPSSSNAPEKATSAQDPVPFHEGDGKGLGQTRGVSLLGPAQPTDESMTVIAPAHPHAVSNTNEPQPNGEEKIEPYVDFTEFLKTEEELGEEVVYGCDEFPVN